MQLGIGRGKSSQGSDIEVCLPPCVQFCNISESFREHCHDNTCTCGCTETPNRGVLSYRHLEKTMTSQRDTHTARLCLTGKSFPGKDACAGNPCERQAGEGRLAS